MGRTNEVAENKLSMDYLLKVQDATKKFGGLAAVNSVSFTLKKGEVVGLIGPNGAGKTTLFNLITRFERIDSGRINFQDNDITHASTADIVNHGIARTFQLVRPFNNISTFDNVLIAALSPRTRRIDKREPEQVAKEALEKVGLTSRSNVDAAHLTHAEQKRVDVARAIATKPDLILLDEPYGGLGSNEIGPMNSLIKELAESRMTILIIEHRLRELMKSVERVLAMDQGSIIADGTPREVTSEARVIEAYLGKKGANIA